jgi:hypothetical protein
MKLFNSNIKSICLIFILVAVSGCATVSDPASMSVQDIDVKNRHQGSVTVRASDDHENVRLAIEKSIVDTGVFEAIVTKAQTMFLLHT